jgi:hypothetical protein
MQRQRQYYLLELQRRRRSPLARLGALPEYSLVLSAMLITPSSPSQSAPAADANEQAYTITLLCAAVASQSRNDADIQRTMEAVRKMARVLGYDNRRLSTDMVKMAGALGVEQRTDPRAMDDHRATCRRIKLIS